MAKLSAAARRALPDSAFAGPDRSFPVNDAAHARAALLLAGHAPEKYRTHIMNKARAELGAKKGR